VLKLNKRNILIFNGNMIIRVKMNEVMEPRDLDKH
jgi:hypothetical protein